MKKIILILFAILTICLNLFADPLLHVDIIKTAISAAQNDQLNTFLTCVDVISIHNQKQQSLSPEKIIELLKSIDIKNLRFDDPLLNIEEGKTTIVALISPLKIKFTVLCTGFPDGEPRFKIIGIFRYKTR